MLRCLLAKETQSASIQKRENMRRECNVNKAKILSILSFPRVPPRTRGRAQGRKIGRIFAFLLQHKRKQPQETRVFDSARKSALVLGGYASALVAHDFTVGIDKFL